MAQLEELLTKEEKLEDIQAILQAKSDLSDIDREQLMDAARAEGDAANRGGMILQYPKIT